MEAKGEEILLEAQADNLAKELHQRENNLPNNQRKRRGPTLLVNENPVLSSSRGENVRKGKNPMPKFFELRKFNRF
ncbi:unnamed protein product [Allacma fusca]|uniref:Uncharacterized protein n=1 Tax=Allacma fusca TaxID=39272 RepID=A0A8J2M357_9HEXA|nr:unnamed protein product [Allacma fusca]